MKLAVVGSRTFNNYWFLKTSIDNYSGGRDLELVSGGAKGADRLAERYAIVHELQIKVFHAAWDTFGRSAGFKRNLEIANYADECYAFVDKPLYESKGTDDTVRKFLYQNKPVTIFQCIDGVCSSYIPELSTEF